MKLLQVAENNKKYYTKDFILGFNTGAKAQYEADKKDAEPIDVQEAYYRGKIDGFKECTARLKKVNEEFANG